MPDMFATMAPTAAVASTTADAQHDDGPSASASSDERDDCDCEHSAEEGEKVAAVDPNLRPRDESPNARRVCAPHVHVHVVNNYLRAVAFCCNS